jgi:FkbM family methyltransferase
MTQSIRKYYEIRPGLDTLRYLVCYGGLTLLARRARRRRHRMFVEIASNIDRHVLSEGLFEKGVIDILRDVCHQFGRTDLMIDIGANIGNHTVALAPLFKRVESVEPHPVLFRVLEANTLLNGLSHVRCHNIGLGSENTLATLEESLDNHALSRIRERSQLAPEVFGLSADAFGREHTIELRSANEFVAQFSSDLDRAFIKIDVEGMEQEILTSLKPLLTSYKPLVGFEWFTASQPKLAEIVTNLPGYELWGIRMHDLGRNHFWRAMKLLFTGRSYTFEPIDPKRLDAVYPLALLVPISSVGVTRVIEA